MSEDRTKAEALRLAKAHLEKLGWKYSAADIGKQAAIIINGMDKELKEAGNE